MAIGVPKRGEDARPKEIQLGFSGKRAVADILSDSAASLRSVFAESNESSLYFGENARVLRRLLKDDRVAGKVQLIYIDPPYATQSVFHSRKLEHAYDDTLSGAHYLEFLHERLVLLREILADNGSIYVHLDAKMIFPAKLLMDEIFGESNFRNLITRKKCNPKNYTRNTYGNISDYLLFYTKSDSYVWNKPLEIWTKERAKEYQYIDTETGRRFMKVPVHAPGTRKGETGELWRGKEPPPGKHWQFPPRVLDEMDARGEIYWSSTGNPRRKVFLDENPGVGVQDIWLEFRDAHNQNVQITGYPTEKNSDLLRRVILASSNPGDLVLDCFAGSGTTLAVAAETDRRWIGIDNSSESIRTIFRRFTKGLEAMGVFVEKQTKQVAVDDLESLFEIEEKKEPTLKFQPIRNFAFVTEEILENQAKSLALEAGFIPNETVLLGVS
jgi:adenine-specific DNA-methyltransferase